MKADRLPDRAVEATGQVHRIGLVMVVSVRIQPTGRAASAAGRMDTCAFIKGERMERKHSEDLIKHEDIDALFKTNPRKAIEHIDRFERKAIARTIHRVSLGTLRDDQIADIYQDTLLVLMQRGEDDEKRETDLEQGIVAYAVGIARNLAKQQVGRVAGNRHRFDPIDAMEVVVDDDEGPEDGVALDDLHETIKRALEDWVKKRKKSQDEKRVIELFFLEWNRRDGSPPTVPELAQKVKKDESTVRRWIAKARTYLQGIFRSKGLSFEGG